MKGGCDHLEHDLVAGIYFEVGLDSFVLDNLDLSKTSL